jgi:hypothetical protein
VPLEVTNWLAVGVDEGVCLCEGVDVSVTVWLPDWVTVGVLDDDCVGVAVGVRPEVTDGLTVCDIVAACDGVEVGV